MTPHLKYRNYTNLSTRTLLQIYRAICHRDLPSHDLIIADALTGPGFGTAYYTAPRHVTVFVPSTDRQARIVWTVGHRTTCRLDSYVYTLAHELFHLWQALHHLPQDENQAIINGQQWLQRFQEHHDLHNYWHHCQLSQSRDR